MPLIVAVMHTAGSAMDTPRPVAVANVLSVHRAEHGDQFAGGIQYSRGHACVLHVWDDAGLATAVATQLASLVWRTPLVEVQVTDRTCTPPSHDTEQADHGDAYHTYVVATGASASGGAALGDAVWEGVAMTRDCDGGSDGELDRDGDGGRLGLGNRDDDAEVVESAVAGTPADVAADDGLTVSVTLVVLVAVNAV